jgi:DNA-binding response OmpR family regulator
VTHSPATELKLLAAFVRNRGRLLTRERLLDEVWGTGIAVTDRVIDNHVVFLRKKIEDEPTVPRYLISVRGAGGLDREFLEIRTDRAA